MTTHCRTERAAAVKIHFGEANVTTSLHVYLDDADTPCVDVDDAIKDFAELEV